MAKKKLIDRLPERELTNKYTPAALDRILGALRPVEEVADPVAMDWTGCPLAIAYPRLDMYLEALAKERATAKAEQRPMHRAAAEPVIPAKRMNQEERDRLVLKVAPRDEILVAGEINQDMREKKVEVTDSHGGRPYYRP